MLYDIIVSLYNLLKASENSDLPACPERPFKTALDRATSDPSPKALRSDFSFAQAHITYIPISHI